MKKVLNSDISNLYNNGNYEKILNSGAVGFVSNALHRSIEKGMKQRKDLLQILEVGSGNGQHVAFVSHAFDRYVMTDIRPEKIVNHSTDKRIEINKTPVDASKLPYIDSSFDRLVATCLLIHIPNSDETLREWKRIVKVGGVVSIYVPSEPSILLRVLRNLTTAKKAKALGIDSRQVHYLEHMYSWHALDVRIRQVFGEENIIRRNYPFRLGFDLSLWSVYQIVVTK